jgi:hypothetical protein
MPGEPTRTEEFAICPHCAAEYTDVDAWEDGNYQCGNPQCRGWFSFESEDIKVCTTRRL